MGSLLADWRRECAETDHSGRIARWNEICKDDDTEPSRLVHFSPAPQQGSLCKSRVNIQDMILKMKGEIALDALANNSPLSDRPNHYSAESRLEDCIAAGPESSQPAAANVSDVGLAEKLPQHQQQHGLSWRRSRQPGVGARYNPQHGR